jgi:hypothetical protein
MRLRHGVAVVAAASLVTAVACSGNLDSACGNYFDQLANFYMDCGFATLIDTNKKSAFVQTCDALGTAPGVSGLAGQIDSCANALANLKSCSTSGFGCVIRGSLSDGSPCSSGAQCAGGRCGNTQTSPNSELACGTCASYVAVGGACPTGLECDPTAGSCVGGTCTAYVSQGGACGGTQPACATNLACVAGTCQPIPTKGQTCTSVCLTPYRCIGGMCADAVAEGGPCPTGIECDTGLTCDLQAHTCQKPTFAQAGQACGVVGTTFVACASGLVCLNSICVAASQAGASCVVGDGDCAAGLLCVSGVCQIPDYGACNQ